MKFHKEILNLVEKEGFFYWLEVIGKEYNLNNAEKGYLIVNSGNDRRKEKR